MKINVRLLFISFVIVAVVSISYTIIYYKVTNEIFSSQHIKTLQNSGSRYQAAFQNLVNDAESEFIYSLENIKFKSPAEIENIAIDFVFKIEGNRYLNKTNYLIKSNVNYEETINSVDDFIKSNPNILAKISTTGNVKYFIGIMISSDLLNKLAEKNLADITLILNRTPFVYSNAIVNQRSINNALVAYREKKVVEDYFYEDIGNSEFYAIQLNYNSDEKLNYKLNFLVFSFSQEMAEFQTRVTSLALVIIFASIVATMLFSQAFNFKLRKQIRLLDKALEITGSGNLMHRVPIITNDEIGKLATAFNSMLDELKKKDSTQRNYSSFITLINQKPSLAKISQSALKKIIELTGYSVGLLYIVEEENFNLTAAYGIDSSLLIPQGNINVYKNILIEKNKVEYFFKENFPQVFTGITQISIRHMLIVPIIYNTEVIALLELCSEKEVSDTDDEFIETIKEQLSIGISNSRAVQQLENLVIELKDLNDEYQKQNLQITEQNQLLTELHEKLQDKAQELEYQKEKAVDLSKVKSQFLASMSHELRTPLNSILGLTELVLKLKEVPKEAVEKLSIVQRNGKRLLILINNILEFSKIESNKFKIKKEKFSLKEIVEEVKSYILPLVMEKNLQFEVTNYDNLDYILETDRDMLEQILINLLGNAVKFTENGVVKLEIKINETDLLITVADTGIGISEENTSKIFDEFSKLTLPANSKQSGTGLGLAICKRYADLLGGEISVESYLNVGSKFFVTLINVVLAKKEITSKIEVKPLSGGNKIALLSENQNSANLFYDYLTQNGFELSYKNNNSDFENLLESEKVSSIIIDANCENINGWSKLVSIKNNTKFADMPIIMFAIFEERKVGFGLRVFDYIKYKCDKAEFEALVNRLKVFIKSNIQTCIFVGVSTNEIFGKTISTNSIKLFESFNVDIFDLERKKPDVIFTELLINNEDCLGFIHKIQKSKILRNIPIVILLPEKVDDLQNEALSKSMKKIAISSSYHPLDVLKVIRAMLKIDIDATLKSRLIEESLLTNIVNVDKQSEAVSENTILIVDDDRDTLYTVGEIIKDLGYKTKFANDGVECLSILSAFKPDLVLLDIMMPRMDGFETIKNIRKQPSFVELPVFALTAHAMLGDKKVIEKNGFTDIITKPINTKLLAQKIKRVLK